MEFSHESVLFEECMAGLSLRPKGIYVDGTLGGGGHSAGICSALAREGKLIGIDQDKEALKAAEKKLSNFSENVTLVHDNYVQIKAILQRLGIDSVEGILLDLGVSSYQLDQGERGFSYQQDAPLDMRMNQESEISAYDVINTYEEKELAEILYQYGEERWAKRIVQFIVNARKTEPIQTTGQLVELIKQAVPKSARRDGPHPAKRTFQAIRIEVNQELEVLKRALEDMMEVLSPGGRLCIITFHSLEDRIVKTEFRRLEHPCTCPREFPICVCGKKAVGKAVNRKPILPTIEEQERNHRSRSAKLRIFEKY